MTTILEKESSMKKSYLNLFGLVLGIGLVLGQTPWLFAQETSSNEFTLEEITVTAAKRVENLQKVSMSISTIKGEDFAVQGATTITDILKDIPNVSTSAMGTPGGSTINIRGLGMDLPPGMGEASVSMNFDGANDARTETSLFGYFDVDRIEVLRGPQGTLYGRNATGGVVNVVSTKPTTDKVKGYAALEIGDYNKKKIEAAVNLPISDTFAARMAFVSTQMDGYTHDDHGYRANQTGLATKLQLGYMPTDEVSLNLVYNYTRTNSGNIFTEISKPNWDAGKFNLNDSTYPYDVTTKNQNTEQRVSLTAEFPVGPGIMTVIPTYELAVGSTTNFALGRGAPGQPPPTIPTLNSDNRPFKNETKIGEVRYASKSDSSVKWTVGLYYLRSTDPMDPVSRAAREAQGRGAADLYSDTNAAFGQVTYPLSDTLRLILGARYSSDKKGYTNATAPFTPLPSASYSFNYFDYKLGVENDFAKDVMGYFTLASGHKPGGFDDQKATPFDMESNVSGELGIKSRFLDNRLQVNADVFYYQYTGYQVVDAASVPDATQPNGFRMDVRFFNAPKAQSQGAEIETTALIGDATELNLNLTYLKNKYSEDFFMHPDANGPAMNLKGFTMPHSPEFTAKFGIAHTFYFSDSSTLRPKISYRWTDKQYLGYLIVPSNLGPAYSVVDFTMSYNAAKSWSLNIYANNALDEHYYNGSVQHGPDTFIFPADPRTVGATLNVRF
jgi:iron complex outermembrane recepter protein